MADKLTVEIFRDIETPEASTKGIEAGVMLINSVIGDKLDLVDTTRKLRVSKSGKAVIQAADIRWGKMSTDFRIVATDRPVYTGIKGDIQGYAERSDDGSGISIVTSYGASIDLGRSVAAHEFGHLLGLKYDEKDDASHCTDDVCIMHKATRVEQHEIRVRKKGVSAWLERRGYVLPEYALTDVDMHENFCSPCENQLARRAFFLLEHKSGKYIPADWR